MRIRRVSARRRARRIAVRWGGWIGSRWPVTAVSVAIPVSVAWRGIRMRRWRRVVDGARGRWSGPWRWTRRGRWPGDSRSGPGRRWRSVPGGEGRSQNGNRQQSKKPEQHPANARTKLHLSTSVRPSVAERYIDSDPVWNRMLRSCADNFSTGGDSTLEAGAISGSKGLAQSSGRAPGINSRSCLGRRSFAAGCGARWGGRRFPWGRCRRGRRR